MDAQDFLRDITRLGSDAYRAGHSDETDPAPWLDSELVDQRLLLESMRRHPSGRRRG